MKQEKILLTISILISNRPDTVGKCLESLSSLRRRVSSELILVDTGCGDQVRRTIEPYADRIVDFKWCNDFARARNAGLKQARGEWFLYLDDDEWFEDTDEIEEFFLSDRHLNYNFGYYIVRNYRDPQGRGYSDDFVGRLIRLDPGVEFRFAVHEFFTEVRGPVIRLNSYVHHYGYVYENEEALRRHCRRNIELLQAERRKDPSEMHHILQLVQEYNALKEWEKVLETADEGIRTTASAQAGDWYRGGFYGAAVRALVALKQYARAVETGETYLKMKEPDELARACVSYFLCIAYLEMGESGKSLEALQRYQEIHAKWQRDKEPFLRYETLLTDETFAEESVRQIAYRGVRCGIRLGKPGLAKEYFDGINWETKENSIDLSLLDLIRDLVRAWLQADASGAQEYTAMMKYVLEDGVLARVAVTELNLLYQRSPELLLQGKADWAALADKNWIFQYFKIRNLPETECGAISEEYCRLWREPQECLARARELGLWEMAARDGIEMGEVLSTVPMQRWKQAAEMAAGELCWRDVQDLQSHLQGVFKEDSYRRMYWEIPYRMREICVMAADRDAEGGDSDASRDRILQALLEYAGESLKLYSGLYREELFETSPGLLPQECQLSLKLSEMADAVEEGNLQMALSAVREALEIMPELSGVLKCCIEWLSEKSAAKSAEQDRARDEMKQLAESVKVQVRNMISGGMANEAAGILERLRQLVPEDEEIKLLEKTVAQMLQNAKRMTIRSRQNILLSISVLISNRPDTVERCLRSLDSLRKHVSSELILVDTGCGKQVRKLIEPYADRIVEFVWCNDFAKARNAGLRQARGEWFLYLDDDEWFEDTGEIEDFFLSGRYLQYNDASYLQRNYFDREGKRYRDEYVGRMIRLEPDTEFIYSIHEGFSKVMGPRCRLHSYVHHYGYAFRNEQEARRHGERNISLLLAELAREPGELRHTAHLVKEYNALKEWEESIRASWEGIRNAKPGVSTEQFLGGLYVNIVRNHVMLGQYVDAAGVGEAYLELESEKGNKNRPAEAAVCYNLCIAYLELEDYGKSLKVAEQYLDFYGKWEKNRDAIAFYEYMAIDYRNEDCRQAALCIAVQDGIRLGDAAHAARRFSEIDWNVVHTMLETQGVRGMVQALVQAWIRTEAAGGCAAAMLDEMRRDAALAGMTAAEICSQLLGDPAVVMKKARELALGEGAEIKIAEGLKQQEVQELFGYLLETLTTGSELSDVLKCCVEWFSERDGRHCSQ